MLDKTAVRKIENKIKERISLWEKSGFLKDLEPHLKSNLAILLENQRLNSDGRNLPGKFKRIAISLTSRIFRNLVANEIVSIQAMLGREWVVRWFDGNDEIREPINALSRNTKTNWYDDHLDATRKDIRFNMDGELADYMAQELRAEIDREILKDVLNAAPHYKHNFLRTEETTRTAYNDLRETIIVLARDMERTGRGANWIITSPEISALFEIDEHFTPAKTYSKWCYLGEVGQAGTLGDKFKIYKDPLFPINTILMGYKGEHPNDAGYFYCPHLILDLDEEKNTGSPRKLKTSYSKKLRFDSDRYYARITLANFIS